MGLHADDFDFGAYCLDVVGHTGNQTAATHGYKHRMQWPLVLAQHFHGDRALTGDHFGVIKGMDKCQAMALAELDRMRVGIRITVTKQHHLTAQGFDRVYFERRCGDRHDDHRTSD